MESARRITLRDMQTALRVVAERRDPRASMVESARQSLAAEGYDLDRATLVRAIDRVWPE